MNYIYNETLGGVVDGVNLVFTTLSNISAIEDVYLGGTPYRNVTFTVGSNIVTFADAPPALSASPTIDYFVGTSSTAGVGDVTFGDMIDDTYEKMGSKRTSKVYNENQIKRQINKGYKRIKNVKAYKDKVLQYTFNKAIDSSAIGYSASTITTVNTAYTPASGAILLGDNTFVAYSAYASGVYSASAGYVYHSGEYVSIGYKIPSGVKRPAEVILDGTVLKYVDNREFNRTTALVYTLFTDNVGDDYIFLPYSGINAIVTVKYIPEYDIFVEDTDIINIEYDYSDVLSLYAAYNVLMLREDDRWQAVKQEYKELIDDMRSYKSSAVDGINNKFNTTSLIQERGGRALSRF